MNIHVCLVMVDTAVNCWDR